MPNKQPKYSLNANGEFVIENYNLAKPFANFFPGIAGKYGIPMWVFYVNRAQGICSFGTKDKDHSILEFFPANKSWQLVSTYGFRTFIKVASGGKTAFYEPFQNGFANAGYKLTNRMRVSPYELVIEEENFSLGLKVKVEYFNIPNDSYAGLARIVTLTNLGKAQKKLQILDGLPQIVPFGTYNFFLKKMSRTIEAWMNVENLDKNIPFYKLSVDPGDRPEVLHITEGNFYLGFNYDHNKKKIIRPVVNPETIFSQVTDFTYPTKFLAAANFTAPQKEIIASKTPCAFLPLNLKLSPHKEQTFYSLIGYTRSKASLNASAPRIADRDYLMQKREENKKLILSLQEDINTVSSSKEFDLYAKQTYLDNILRGGYPVTFGKDSQTTLFYLYSRKHGDLERDYNRFQLQPAYFSQGNGNYRDLNQNRRSDIWFNPEIKDENLVALFSLLQADGFNPLVVKGVNFLASNGGRLEKILHRFLPEGKVGAVKQLVTKPFTPGDLILFIEENGIKLKASYDAFLDALIPSCIKIQEAEHGEGFWTDHWHYNLDLLESYLGVYPEKLKEIFFEKRVFTFYDNMEIVKPRSEKYILQDGLIKQLHAVASDNAKREMIKQRTFAAHVARARYGEGEIYQTSLTNKFLCLLANKLSSLDPFGCGIEMEANKPNWFDALNGLPALLGSSSCETFELKRLIIILKEALDKTGVKEIPVTEEIYGFLTELNKLIGEGDYKYWDASHTLKENYWQKTKMGFSGKEIAINSDALKDILDNALKKVNSALEKALDKKRNICCAYFMHEIAEYKPLESPYVKPAKFIRKELPLFLEGQMHALRLSGTLKEAKLLHKATKISRLYDNKLKMYKVTEPLLDMPFEIGRCRIFTPGWLENESIWLHMEYKYLLEVLKSGLYAEFYDDFKNALIPFQKPLSYGRSILENSSFLVSSAFPDKNLHGNGFVTRLSGSTAEFIQMWLILNIGKNPFFLDKNERLNLCFAPILSGWLFNQKGDYSFNFLSTVSVTYHNPKKKNTFGAKAVRPIKISFSDKNGKLTEINSDTIPSPYAHQIRSRQIKKIDVYLG